jgi:myosin protein heavy chain
LQANPILEAFGNAKTLRNNNSSRFGKFIELNFNSSGFIAGASIVSYLLEKSRVIFQGKNERSFHIFYQLISGSPPDQYKALYLEKPESYNFLKGSGCFTVRNINDVEEYKDTLKAFDIMSFSAEDKDSILKIVSGILLLGNLSFVTSFGEGSALGETNTLNKFCELLGVDASKLEQGLCKPRIRAGSELITTHLNVEKASYSREALAKALYHRLFLWLVNKINEQLTQERAHSFIGVLDISGFEIFQVNSFEVRILLYNLPIFF